MTSIHDLTRAQLAEALDGEPAYRVNQLWEGLYRQFLPVSEVRTLPAGSAVLVEDLVGRGHVTTHAPGPQRVLLIPLDPA